WTETTSKVSLATGKKRTVAHSKKRTLTEANLLAATLARHNITDPTGWSLVACARKASFASFADFDLMAHHVDGTLLPLSTATHLNTVPLGKSEYSPNLTAWT